ncbi:MAG: YcbK family protein [Phyllobacterium sp.]
MMFPYSARCVAAFTALFFCFGILAAGIAASPAKAGNIAKPANPWQRLGAHLFDDEHAHLLGDSVFDTINPLILAAMPRGKAYIQYNAPSKCVPARLRKVLNRVSARYGPITVNSTVRSRAKNRRVGGRSKSYHLSCQAVDFRVHGRSRGLMKHLAASGDVGGLKRYPAGYYHIDTGPRRSW